MDCGASSLIAMRRFGVDPSAIDAVILSHLHGDHFGGVPFLILDGQFTRRTRPLVVAGPPGLEARGHGSVLPGLVEDRAAARPSRCASPATRGSSPIPATRSGPTA
jgi:ribonuclease BN (tRNA processing enzyme)